MASISEHIYQVIKSESFADPFSKEFDKEKLADAFGKVLNEDEANILKFLITCNEFSLDIIKEVFSLFDNLNLSHEDLREFCFIAINKQFLDLTPTMLEQMKEGFSHEAEKSTFSTFKNEAGQVINSQFAIELGGDILATLIHLSYKWEASKTEFEKLADLNPEKHGLLFRRLWFSANIFLNIRDSAFQIIKYENGKVTLRKDGEVKIENGLNATAFLKKAGFIRGNNNTNEFLFNFLKFYGKAFEERKGVEGFATNGNVLSPIIGKSDSSIKARGDSSLFVFYPHFANVKLEYFDGLTLFELLDLLVLVEECIEKLQRENIEKYSERTLAETPIKFKEDELLDFLCQASGRKTETVKKFLSSIIADTEQPYFWREPLWKSGEFLYFSLAAIVAPNHVLFFDKWTRLSGFSFEDKEVKFTELVRKELRESKQINYRFDFIDLSKLKVDVSKFQNNILIETASLLILLEIKLFDFPIESAEIDSALIRLGNATFDVEEKVKQILKNFDGKKELIKILVPNDTSFSGLVINNIPIADLTLFKNYVTVGEIKRVAVTFHDGNPVQSSSVVYRYYNNEDEFNSKLKGFFFHPVPVSNILDRLYLKEIPLTPESMKPVFFVDSIDHVSDEQLMENRLNNLSGLLNYEYFGEPEDKVIKNELDQSIIYSLTEIFSQLSYAPYESYEDRIELYNKVSKTKMLGFVHLAFYILKALEKLNGKKIKMNKYFDSVEYDADEVFELIERGKLFMSGQVRLSEFKIEEGTYSEVEEKQIISFAIDGLSGLTQKHFGNDILESAMFTLALLHGLSHKYDVAFEFYIACSNVIDGLNHIHKYQSARDLAEEILVLSINNNKHSHGWNILFKCYSAQKNTFDASINGCLFLSSISVLPEISNFFAVDALYGALKYFRNFGFNEFAKFTYENLQHFELTEYDKQKITLSYFNSFLHGEIQRDVKLLDQVIDYIDSKIDDIISFNEQGVVPWLAYLYNIERLKKVYQFSFDRDIKKYIDKFEASIDKASVEAIRLKILGDDEKPKELFVSAILNTFETRSVRDFVHEAQHLTLIASNLLQSAISTNDIDKLLLTGLVLNDQSLTFEEVDVKPGSTSAVSKPENSELKLRLNNYKYYLLSKINLKPEQTLLWLFEDLGKVFCLTLNHEKNFNLYPITNWEMKKTKRLLRRIGNFYFNAKKDSEGNARCLFSNPRGEHDYNDLIQKEDYENLLRELSFTKLPFNLVSDEILIYSSIEMASYPHNLIEFGNDFIAAQKTICNVISIERFAENHKQLTLKKDYSSSAWIPKDDKEPTISWGFELLNPLLKEMKAKIFTSTYPNEVITTDLNIFLAHGVTDGSGFKAVYSNHVERKGIVYPYSVFGKGKVAILFICNSGSSHDSVFSNSVISFSSELLKSGYETVIAPFWPFQVEMSRIWLKEFLSAFNVGYSISQATFLANNKLTEYDEETSSFHSAPAGSLAMHIYGNPNVYVER